MKKFLAFAIPVILILCLWACADNDNNSERDINTCKGCGKSFYAGDAAGNYKNITWTNLCNKCEAEAKAYGELKDYLELN